MMTLTRRKFLAAAGVATLATAPLWFHRASGRRRVLISYRRDGRPWVCDPLTLDCWAPELPLPDGTSTAWFGRPMDGGRKILVQAIGGAPDEALETAKNKLFVEKHFRRPTRTWLYDWPTGNSREILDKFRSELFVEPVAVFPDGKQLLVHSVREDGVGVIEAVRLDGKRIAFFKDCGLAMHYGFAPSPDGERLVFHMAGPAPLGYHVVTSDWFGGSRTEIACSHGHTIGFPAWSPDGSEILALDYPHRPWDEPDHEGCDLIVADPTGKGWRNVVYGRHHWGLARYGDPAHRGGGTNDAAWFDDASVLATWLPDGSHSPWRTIPGPDRDHFNSEFRPAGRTGSFIVRVDSRSGKTVNQLTQPVPGQWNFGAIRCEELGLIAFRRWQSSSHDPVGVWLMRDDGSDQRHAFDGDFPRFIEAIL